MAMCGALSYSELAIRFPQSGGEYVYLRAGYGEKVAFLYGWSTTIVMYPGLVAALAVGSTPYVAQLLPAGFKGLAAVPALLICLFGVINLIGTRLGATVMSLVNGFKLVILFALVGWAVVSGHAHVANLLPFTVRRPGSDPLFPAIAGGVMSAFFSFGGWWEAGKIAGEIRNPRRTLPLAFVGGVTLVTAIYLLISATFLAVLPIDQVSSNTAFVAQFGGVLFGAAGARVLSACVLVCICGGIAAITMAAPRVCYAMSRSGAFFSALRKAASPLRHTGECHPSANRAGAGGALLRRLRPDVVLHHLFGGPFSRPGRFHAFQATRAGAAWWFPGRADRLYRLVGAGRLAYPDARSAPALVGVAIVFCGIPFRKFLLPRQEAIRLVQPHNG